MDITNEQTTTRMTNLFEQGRRYLQLQKDYLSLHGVEVLTRLFSAIALAAILILVGFLVVLFGSFALAYWLGELLGSHILGFTIIAGVLLLFTLLVYANRKAWIILPTTRFMVSLLTPQLTISTQEGITLEKERVQEQLTTNQGEIKETTSALLSPIPEARTRWETISNLLQNGLTLYRGLQLGLSALAAARTVFGLGKRHRRR